MRAATRSEIDRAVRDGCSDQRVTGHLACQEESRHVLDFQRIGQRRDVPTVLQVAQCQVDGTYRTGLGAESVPNAPRAENDHGLAVDQIKYALLRARSHASTATKAPAEIDVRILQPSLVTALVFCLRQFLEPT